MDKDKILSGEIFCPDEFRVNETIEVKVKTFNSDPKIELPSDFLRLEFILIGFRVISEVDFLDTSNKAFIFFEDKVPIPRDLNPIEKRYKLNAKNQKELKIIIDCLYNSRHVLSKKYQFYKTDGGIYVPK
ncbi:hypothetical protein HYX16_06700 [Candidatus Woesearchaeota archaeon]|nr:hypothetical protein [Candidatus Woesearchaeota archaeon]